MNPILVILLSATTAVVFLAMVNSMNLWRVDTRLVTGQMKMLGACLFCLFFLLFYFLFLHTI